jgi:mannose-6-phosphate isomerase-like protein (cupin superfamily)
MNYILSFQHGLVACLILSSIAHLNATPPVVLAEKEPVLQVVTLSEQPWYEAEDRAVAREIASPRNSKLKSMSIADIIIPAGVAVVPHHHVMEEVYYIVEGEGIMMVEDEEVLVKAGQSVIISPHQWHNIRNHTDQPLRLIVTCAPAWAPELLEFDRATIPE